MATRQLPLLGLTIILCMAAASASLLSSDELYEETRLIQQGYKPSISESGFIQYVRESDKKREFILRQAGNRGSFHPLFSDHVAKKLENSQGVTPNSAEDDPWADILKCEPLHEPEAYQFIPELVTIAKLFQDPQEFRTPCYLKNEVSVFQSGWNAVTVKITPSENIELLCFDTYMIGAVDLWHSATSFMGDTIEIVFADLNSSQLQEMFMNGVKIWRFCDFPNNLMSDVYLTKSLFQNQEDEPNLPEDVITWNNIFMERVLNYKVNTLATPVSRDLSIDDLAVGDVILYFKPSGLQSLNFYLTGSPVLHTGIVVNIDNEQQFCQATYLTGGSVECQAFDTWYQWANDHDYSVFLFALGSSQTKNFSNTKAVDAIHNLALKNTTGYAYPIMAWIDTLENNYPGLLNAHTLIAILSFWESENEPLVRKMVKEPLLVLLGHNSSEAERMSMLDIVLMASHYGILPEKLLSHPLDDTQVDRLVDAAFVVSVLDAAGILEDKIINANEFTVRDLFQSQLYGIRAISGCGGTVPCHLSGRYELEFTDVNLYPIEDHSAENCPARAPEFKRPQDCQK